MLEILLSGLLLRWAHFVAPRGRVLIILVLVLLQLSNKIPRHSCSFGLLEHGIRIELKTLRVKYLSQVGLAAVFLRLLPRSERGEDYALVVVPPSQLLVLVTLGVRVCTTMSI